MEEMIANLGFPIAGAIGMSGVLVFLIKYLIERDKICSGCCRQVEGDEKGNFGAVRERKSERDTENDNLYNK